MSETAEPEAPLGLPPGGGGFDPVFQEEPEEESSVAKKVNALFTKQVGEDWSLVGILVGFAVIALLFGLFISSYGLYKSKDDAENYASLFAFGLTIMVFCVVALAVMLLAEHMVGGLVMIKESLVSRTGSSSDEEEEDEGYLPPEETEAAGRGYDDSEMADEEEEQLEDLEADDEEEELVEDEVADEHEEADEEEQLEELEEDEEEGADEPLPPPPSDIIMPSKD